MKQELEIIAQNEMPPRIPERSFLERFPDTPKSREDLLAHRNARLKFEVFEDAKAKKAFRDRVMAAQMGKGPGHWEFENEEEQFVAHIFLRNIYDGQIMARYVYREQLIEEKVSVVLSIQLKWVEDDAGVRRPSSSNSSFSREQKGTPDAFTTEERDDIVVNIPKKQQCGAKLPTNMPPTTQGGTSATARKRKQPSTAHVVEPDSNKKQKMPPYTTSPTKSPALDVMEAAVNKKQNMATRPTGDPKFANAKQEMKYLADEIAKLTSAWLRWVYQEYSSTTVPQESNDLN